MTWLFSKRCEQGLSRGTIRPTFPLRLRGRLWKALDRFQEGEDLDSQGFYHWTTLDGMSDRLEEELGGNILIAYPADGGHEPIESDLQGFVRRGPVPAYLLDLLELFYLELNQNKTAFQDAVNIIFEEEDSPWRMANGKVFPIESEYVEEIRQRGTELLRTQGFEGALQEFEEARKNLANGDCLGAIRNASLAVESVEKQILGVSKAKPGELARGLAQSGIIPQYHEGFLTAFEEHFIRCPSVIRNEQPGAGHGRGLAASGASRPLAEFAVNTSAVVMTFLVDSYVEYKEETIAGSLGNHDVNDIPFDQ